jgi:purine-binding chemotaxis protein CheW
MEVYRMDEQLVTAGAEDDIQEYLIFTIDSIDFGIDIGLVQEIIEIQPVSKIPNALDFCSGIINIRGTIVPVIDMRRKLGFQPIDYDDRACIIVILLESELVGAVVDAVQDVIHISTSELTDSPVVDGQSVNRKHYTSKIACIDGNIKQILDIATVFDINEE